MGLKAKIQQRMELRICEVDKGYAARVTNAREVDPSAGSADEGEWESMY